MTKYIVVKLVVEGIHCWPECPIEEVKFLREPHRHLFHIRASKEVSHNDRDIEIIKLKRDIRAYLWETYGDGRQCQFDRMSCEDLAEEILKEFNCEVVEVLEDNENGAIVTL